MSKYDFDFDTSDSSHKLLSLESSFNNLDLSKIKFTKIFTIIICAFVLNFAYSLCCYYFLYGEISNAKEYTDFFYFGLVTLSTTGYGDMGPTTTKAKIFISVYLLLLYSFMLSIAL
jgi:hypothetical protein